jgi:hypothetical protein
MELSVLGQSTANVSTASLTQHTHHITMKDAAVSFETVETTSCPTFNPPTSGSVLVVTGDASITANGGIPPFAPTGEPSPLTVCVSGGTITPYANVTFAIRATRFKPFWITGDPWRRQACEVRAAALMTFLVFSRSQY